MRVGGKEPSSGGSRTLIPMDPIPLSVELLHLHTSGIWSEQSNTRWFKAREGNWIFTCHTSRPDSCWFHSGKLPWASAEVRVQCAGKFPSSISWEWEQPMAGAAMPGKPLWILPWSTGLLSSGVSRHHRKEPALLPTPSTTSAEPQRSKGSWWLLALRSGHLCSPWGSSTSRGIPRP